MDSDTLASPHLTQTHMCKREMERHRRIQDNGSMVSVSSVV